MRHREWRGKVCAFVVSPNLSLRSAFVSVFCPPRPTLCDDFLPFLLLSIWSYPLICAVSRLTYKSKVNEEARQLSTSLSGWTMKMTSRLHCRRSELTRERRSSYTTGLIELFHQPTLEGTDLGDFPTQQQRSLSAEM